MDTTPGGRTRMMMITRNLKSSNSYFGRNVVTMLGMIR